MRKTHSLKGRKVFYSVYENISETLVPAQNMITRHTRGCVTLQSTFLECGFSCGLQVLQKSTLLCSARHQKAACVPLGSLEHP